MNSPIRAASSKIADPGATPSPKLPAIQLDTDDLPRIARFLVFRQRTSKSIDITLDKAADERFRIKVQAWKFNDFVIGTVETYCRLKAVRCIKRVKADGGDQCAIILFRSGGLSGEADDTPVTTAPGEVLMFDRARTNAFTVAASHFTILIVRRDRLAQREGLPHGLVVPGAIGTMLADYIDSLARRLPCVTPTEALYIERSTIEVIRACISAMSDKTTRPNAQLQQSWKINAKRIVDDRLHDLDLGPETIARTLGISRSALYRLLENEEGGVSAFIRRRRLRAASRLIMNPEERRRVSELAAVCGFKSDSHFSRAFRDEFGMTPSEFRASGPVSAEWQARADESVAIVENWVARMD